MEDKVGEAVVIEGPREAFPGVELLANHHAQKRAKMQRIKPGNPMNKKSAPGNDSLGHPAGVLMIKYITRKNPKNLHGIGTITKRLEQNG